MIEICITANTKDQAAYIDHRLKHNGYKHRIEGLRVFTDAPIDTAANIVVLAKNRYPE